MLPETFAPFSPNIVRLFDVVFKIASVGRSEAARQQILTSLFERYHFVSFFYRVRLPFLRSAGRVRRVRRTEAPCDNGLLRVLRQSLRQPHEASPRFNGHTTFQVSAPNSQTRVRELT